MTLESFHKRGFRILKETRRPVDMRGIDGVLILRKVNGRGHILAEGKNAPKLYVSAHYKVGNRYGEPLPYFGQ